MNTYLIVIIAIIVIAAYVGYNYRKKLLDSGQIVNRRAGFEEYAEIFTIKEMPFSEIANALKGADYYKKANVSVNSEKEAVGFSGAGWTAHIYHMKDDMSRNAYCFEFTGWQTRKGMNYETNAMNTVLTAVEKTFLQLDPDTQVSSKKIEIKTRSKFF